LADSKLKDASATVQDHQHHDLRAQNADLQVFGPRVW
jgi:hypothetical protein